VITPAQLRRSCLDLPGAAEEFPFRPDLSVFKVSGKVFALAPLKDAPLTVSLKCEPALAEQLRDTYPGIRPGYHLNKRHWNTVDVDGSVPDRLVLDMVEDSYDLVVEKLPRATRERLGWSAG
jgi:predicted DNA-binding protein (MmcQ/YjbR family)